MSAIAFDDVSKASTRSEVMDLQKGGLAESLFKRTWSGQAEIETLQR